MRAPMKGEQFNPRPWRKERIKPKEYGWGIFKGDTLLASFHDEESANDHLSAYPEGCAVREK